MSLDTKIFKNKEELVEVFSDTIVKLLKKALAEKGQASLVVSGGSTPLPLFRSLSNSHLEWDKVSITLADERWVSHNSDASNTKLVKENLLQGKASKARFISMTTSHSTPFDAIDELTERFESFPFPIDVLILGMGEDGHTASLFPCSKQIEQALNTEGEGLFVAVEPVSAPHLRISFSLEGLLNSKHVFLHLTGTKKKEVLDNAILKASELEKPIKAVCDRKLVTLMWAP